MNLIPSLNPDKMIPGAIYQVDGHLFKVCKECRCLVRLKKFLGWAHGCGW